MRRPIIVQPWGRLARGAIAPIGMIFLALGAASCQPQSVQTGIQDVEKRWYRGNLHTHSLWSDGDDYPEMIAAWYREHGYDFVVMTDHNVIQSEERWTTVPASGRAAEAYRKYRERFGASWVEERRLGDTAQVRLRRLEEYRGLVEEPGAFLLVRGEEITQYVGGKGAHVNAFNLAEVIPPQSGETVPAIVRTNLDLVAAQREAVGRPMIAQLNHPNFLWSVTAEELAALSGARFFEVYNGHPLVYNEGDSLHAGTERLWDIALTRRLTAGGPVVYGNATDDAHDYHAFGHEHRNPGRGWVMVRSVELTASALLEAMERGDFYSSTGVTLAEVRRDGGRITIAIHPETGVIYTTQFVGTRRGYDTSSTPVTDSAGRSLTSRYSHEVGAVLAERTGATADYTLLGDELYVRARIVSSRSKANPSRPGEMEMAWTQPFVRPADGW